MASSSRDDIGWEVSHDFVNVLEKNVSGCRGQDPRPIATVRVGWTGQAVFEDPQVEVFEGEDRQDGVVVAQGRQHPGAHPSVRHTRLTAPHSGLTQEPVFVQNHFGHRGSRLFATLV